MRLELVYFLLGILLIYTLKIFLLKINFLIEKKSTHSHKNLLMATKPKVQVGGIVLLVLLTPLLLKLDFYFFISLFFLIIIGILSDVNVVESPKLRILIQFFITLFLVLLSPILVTETRIDFIDLLLNNFYFKIIFTTFCFLILINGSNFIDGINTLLLGYYLIVAFFIVYVCKLNNIEFFQNFFLILIFILTSLIIFNFNSSIIMGDSGAYVLAAIFGYFSIKLSNEFAQISPIFILNLLWYPAFENLFSILRKFYTRLSPSTADNKHLHHLIFIKLNSKINNKHINSITGLIINVFNFITILLACNIAGHTFYLSVLLCFNIMIYTFLYFKLNN